MDRKVANIILKTCVAVWILLSIVALCAMLASKTPFEENIRYFIQLLLFLIFCIWLGVYIWKALKKS